MIDLRKIFDLVKASGQILTDMPLQNSHSSVIDSIAMQRVPLQGSETTASTIDYRRVEAYAQLVRLDRECFLCQDIDSTMMNSAFTSSRFGQAYMEVRKP